MKLAAHLSEIPSHTYQVSRERRLDIPSPGDHMWLSPVRFFALVAPLAWQKMA